MDGERFDRIAWVRGTIPSRHGSSLMQRVTVSVVALSLLALLGLGGDRHPRRPWRGRVREREALRLLRREEGPEVHRLGWFFNADNSPYPLRGGLAAWRCGARRRR